MLERIRNLWTRQSVPAQPLAINQIDVAKLAVGPGEVLMVITNEHITKETARHIGEGFKLAFEKSGGVAPGIIVMDGVKDIKVIANEHA